MQNGLEPGDEFAVQSKKSVHKIVKLKSRQFIFLKIWRETQYIDHMY